MIKRLAFLGCLVAYSFFIFGLAHAQSAEGIWNMSEGPGSPTVAKLILSRDGSASLDVATTGTWSQSGQSVRVTLYGNQQLRNAGMPISDLTLELNGDTLSGKMYNHFYKKTFNMFTQRQ